MYRNLGIHWASSIPAFLALACVPFPFLFYKCGDKIRLKCKYAAEAAAALERMNQKKDEEVRKDEKEGRSVNKDVSDGEKEKELEADVESGSSSNVKEEKE
jgi:hypothetical protein